MNFTNIQNTQNNQKISRKRKYDNFCGNFQIPIKNKKNYLNTLYNDNKRLKTQVYNLKEQIKILENKISNLSLETKEEKKDNDIPCELAMFYYL